MRSTPRTGGLATLGFSVADAFCPASPPPLLETPPAAGLKLDPPLAPVPETPPVVEAPSVRRFDPARAIVIGDSQSEGLEWGGRMPCEIEDHRGMSVPYFQTLITEHPELVRDRDLVVLQMGGNDISGGRSADTIIANMRAVIQRIHDENPHATIVLSTVPVRGQFFATYASHARREAAQRTLDTVNEWIRTHAGEAGYEVFDVNEIVADPARPTMQREEFRRSSPTDVHFNRRGYREIGTAMAAALFGT